MYIKSERLDIELGPPSTSMRSCIHEAAALPTIPAMSNTTFKRSCYVMQGRTDNQPPEAGVDYKTYSPTDGVSEPLAAEFNDRRVLRRQQQQQHPPTPKAGLDVMLPASHSDEVSDSLAAYFHTRETRHHAQAILDGTARQLPENADDVPSNLRNDLRKLQQDPEYGAGPCPGETEGGPKRRYRGAFILGPTVPNHGGQSCDGMTDGEVDESMGREEERNGSRERGDG